ncbi:MAG: DUF11 domain-containing protein, partial [Chloroflexota bacterium]
SSVSPTYDQRTIIISYDRGALIEQYLAHLHSIEQQFVIPDPLPLNGQDLIITGEIESNGAFEQTANGWLWRTKQGVVSLGQVYVFDSAGHEITAELQVDATTTKLIVDGVELAKASYPVTIDPEIGTNDFRISDAGGDGNASVFAVDAAVAYNSTANEYLVVWEADDTDSSGVLDQEREIFGQRIDGTTGEEVGTNDFRISDAGGDGNTLIGAFNPAVAYNSTDNEYLVVWEADDTDSSGVLEGEFEVFGQRLNGTTGEEVGTNDFRISDAGGNGNTNIDAGKAAVVYNSTENEYLVVWESDDTDSGSIVNEAFEIFGQRLDGTTGVEVGTNDFRISDVGGDTNTLVDARRPAVAYNSTDNEYLVVWHADDTDAPGITNDEFEIFGQRLNGTTGEEVGTNDFRISDVDGSGSTNSFAQEPSVAYNSVDNEYLVVWEADDPDTSGIVNDEFEIFGQRLDGMTGAVVGTNDFRISDAGGTGNANIDAGNPSVVYNSDDNEYLVVWDADDTDSNGIIDNEFEVFGQRLDGATGSAVGTNDFRISDVGGDGSTNAGTFDAAVAYNSNAHEYLAVWEADDTDTSGIVNDEFEIFGQRLTFSLPTLVAINPLSNSHTAPLTTTITATYDQLMDAPSVNTQTFAVYAMETGLLTQPFGVAGKQIIVTPTNAFKPGELVQVSATTGTTNITGTNPLSPTVWQFRAMAGVGPAVFDDFVNNFGTGSDQTHSVAFGDVDGDGDLDLAVGNRSSQQNVVYLNDGDGTFDSTSHNFGSGNDITVDVAFGDVDGDGDLDLAVGNRSQQNVVYLNDGDGTFDSLSRNVGPINDETRSVAFGDVDGDGDLDLAVGNNGEQDVVYLNDGDGTFDSISHNFGTGSDDTNSVRFGDVDGDGDLDLAVGKVLEQNVVYLNDGDGTFDTIRHNFGTGSDQTYAVAFGDVDDDGDLDLAAGNVLEQNVVYLNDGDGTFDSLSNNFGLGNDDTRSVLFGDLDGDDDLDLAVGNWVSSGQNVVYLNDGDGTFDSTNNNFGSGGDNTLSAVLGDVDGDGDLDIAMGNTGEQNVVALNKAPVSLAADIAVAKTVTSIEPIAGDTITYTITITNNGPDTAVNIVMTDTLPTGITYGSLVSASSGIYTPGMSGLWTGITLTNQTTATLIYTATVDQGTTGQTLTNTAVISSDAVDGILSNNQAQASVTVTFVDLAIRKMSVYDQAANLITYTIVVSNVGTADAPGAMISDALPATIASFSWDCVALGGISCPNASGTGAISETIGSFPVGGQLVYTIQATPISNTITVTNTATVTTTGIIDTNSSNNAAIDSRDIGTAQTALYMPLIIKTSSGFEDPVK